MSERNYDFRARLSQVHRKGLRDDRVWPRYEGLRVDESFEIVYPACADETTEYAAYDLMEFFRDAMGMHLRVRAGRDMEAEAAASAGRIVLGTARELPALAPAGAHPAAHRLAVSDGIVVCGRDGRGAAQGCYEIEWQMGLHCGPVIARGESDRAPRFSPRMVHSGYGLDMYPDEHLRAIAHAGMDAILVFVKDVDTTPHGYLDFNDLIRRAGRYGLDVYAYSYLISRAHPDDPGARAHYESTYGRLFDRCPGFRGVILVGESCEFPSRDPRVVPYDHRTVREHPELNPKRLPTPGWFPCGDYPQWVALVRDIVRARRPDADIVFWTYNWGWADEKDRLALIANLPTDITLQATWEMFEDFQPEPNVRLRCTDYTLFFEGPGTYFASEARAAHARGIRLYAMTNTGGLTWDIGDIPYEPCPGQWNRRWEGLIRAREAWGLSGLMESHHYGFWPSFVGELARARFWTPDVPYPQALRGIAVRDYTEAHADTALRALECFSEGIRCYVSTNEDQYGPFRIGPAYPLLYEEDAQIPTVAYAHFGGNRICKPMYRYDLGKIDTLRYEIGRITRMRDLFREGARLLQGIEPALDGRRLEDIRRLIALAEFIWRSAETTVHVKEWYLLKRSLQAGEGDRADIVRRMRAIGEDEIENARLTMPLAAFDSRLGFEPSMEYVCDPAHLEWKIACTRRAMAALDGPATAGKEQNR